ncbi:hypothetical protein A2863_00695 [Candidatus Woesebacteria bacterium RIFCSPHIGHO2_01_FULL_38_9b]|uniref:Uncharacterized protein n=1 Tax=Candidatus Woesebacteria bacterium RIFCSPHIGHO2_01_FULL_38_9b TaxID=1802493 RepID=A0A1F7Y4F4_9BACT|nr:MAG: hypothetical protein A2863_00695 [Candidatus Woesebacteria bacterium RIFCSPHIGHO2_01_FULL_38_9b]
MSEKITGYLLVLLGIIIMAIASYSVYSVFTNKAKPVSFFKLPGVALDLGSFVSQEETAVPAGQSLKTELVSPEIINEPMNLLAHLLLMGFIVNAGYKLASLGVQFVRPIKVTIKESKSILEPSPIR